MNLHSYTFVQHYSLHKNKLLVPQGNQLLPHSWKTPSTLLLWKLHTLGNGTCRGFPTSWYRSLDSPPDHSNWELTNQRREELYRHTNYNSSLIGQFEIECLRSLSSDLQSMVAWRSTTLLCMVDP